MALANRFSICRPGIDVTLGLTQQIQVMVACGFMCGAIGGDQDEVGAGDGGGDVSAGVCDIEWGGADVGGAGEPVGRQSYGLVSGGQADEWG